MSSSTLRWLRRLSAMALPFVLASCGSTGETKPPQTSSGVAGIEHLPRGQIEVHALAQKPSLSVISREGDPAPAIAVVFATGLGSLPTAALSAVIEARLSAAGFSTRVRAHRSAFRVELFVDAPARVGPFLAALSRAMREPLVAGGPEMPLVAKRVDAVQKAPLDAPELDPVAACTGQPGLVPGQTHVDPSTPAFLTQLETQRQEAMNAGRVALAATGPAAFGSLVVQELSRTEDWPVGSPIVDNAPAADTLSTYVVPPTAKPGRVVVAVRLGDAFAAVTTAERLAAPGSALRGRLSGLSSPFRPVEIAGFARPYGGCISITLDADDHVGASSLERAAAHAAAIARHEINIEMATPPSTSAVARQILSATDPRDVASRAAWWALSTPLHGAAPRAAVVLGMPPASGLSASSSLGRTFSQEHERVLLTMGSQVVERRFAVERGQGELWVLVGSPCGVAEEGAQDAGFTALSLLSAVAAQGSSSGVTLEPWVGAEGVGLFAHAPPKDDRETPADLARRVGDAAMRALSPASATTASIVEARTSQLTYLERSTGRGGIAFEALLGSLAPEHPSWIEPYGTYTRVGTVTLDVTRLRLRSLIEGPMRVAVLANVDVPQASEVAFSVDRWISPRDTMRMCPSPMALSAPTVHSAKRQLPRDAGLAQAFVAAPVPPVGAVGHDLAMLTALLLGGEGGLFERTFPPSSGVRANVRVSGTTRAAAMVVDLRAPSDLLPGAIALVKGLFTTMATSGVAPADMQRTMDSATRRVSELRFDPHKRLLALWNGPTSVPASPLTSQAVAIFVGSTLNEASLVVVEAYPDN